MRFKAKFIDALSINKVSAVAEGNDGCYIETGWHDTERQAAEELDRIVSEVNYLDWEGESEI